MIDIHKIISSLYADKSYQEVKDILDEYGFYTPVHRAVIILNHGLSSEIKLVKSGNFKSVQIGHIAAILLFSVNEKLRAIKDDDKRTKLEELLGTICKKILIPFFSLTKSDPEILAYQLLIALEDTCHFYDYDFEKLRQFLRIENEVFAFVSQSGTGNEGSVLRLKKEGKIPGYIWNGEPKRKSEFISIVSDVTKVKYKDASLLFNEPKCSLKLAFNKKEADIILHFFSAIKGKLISASCQGYYKVLQYHVLYFDDIFLKNKTPQVRINEIKNNKAKYLKNKEKIDEWIKPYIKN